MWFILPPQQQPIMKATYECICKYAICKGRRHGSPFSNRIICTFEFVYLSCVSILCICASAWVALAGTGPQISIEAILFVYLCIRICASTHCGHRGTGPKMPIRYLMLCISEVSE